MTKLTTPYIYSLSHYIPFVKLKFLEFNYFSDKGV